MNPRSLALAWLAILGACAPEGTAPSRARAAPIIGGTVEQGEPAVVAIWMGGACSGTVVAPRVVLTAAHCVQPAVDSGTDGDGLVIFGNRWESPDAVIDVVRAVYHREYNETFVGRNDVAMVLLSEDAPVAPEPINRDPLEGALAAGDRVRSVGFGQNQLGSGFGIKRSGDLLVQSIAPRHVRIGELGLATCFGDSGGPDFFSIDGERRIVGVHSYTAGCVESVSMRADAFWDRFFVPILAAWDGPCKHDGTCVTTGCDHPDPDCDPCGFQGTCAEACVLPDLDCPLSGLLGDPCVDDVDCESRICLAALDDPRIHYCTELCDTKDEIACTAAMECVRDGARAVCAFPPPSPTAQGDVCDVGEDCRSGMCDPEQKICVEPCDPSAPVCAQGYTCQASSLGAHACRVPEGTRAFSSICGVARRGSRGWWPLALTIVGWGATTAARIARRARRRRR